MRCVAPAAINSRAVSRVPARLLGVSEDLDRSFDLFRVASDDGAMLVEDRALVRELLDRPANEVPDGGVRTH
jgi:hypothetical protein